MISWFNERILNISEQSNVIAEAYLKEHRESLRNDIENLYKSLSKIAYVLSSILVHEGSASYGHYFAYIFDPLK